MEHGRIYIQAVKVKRAWARQQDTKSINQRGMAKNKQASCALAWFQRLDGGLRSTTAVLETNSEVTCHLREGCIRSSMSMLQGLIHLLQDIVHGQVGLLEERGSGCGDACLLGKQVTQLEPALAVEMLSYDLRGRETRNTACFCPCIELTQP